MTKKFREIFKDIKKNPFELLKISVLVLFILWTAYQKYGVFDESGGDFEAYRNATKDFLSGINPYEYTYKSFSQPLDDFGEEIKHGYAYLPGLMYVQAPLYILYEHVDYPLQRIWKAPLLLADIAVAGILIWLLYKKSYPAAALATVVWSFHPFFAVIGSYTNWEPYPVLLLLLALVFLEEKEDLSSVFYALAVAFKTFPLILLPLFLLKSKNKLRFLMIGGLIYFAISIPFWGSWEDFTQYIWGSLLVHGGRELQGRPLLSYLNAYFPINLYQVSQVSLYSKLAILVPWSLSAYFLIKKKLTNKYIISMISFLIYYLLTPVLNRTHMIWGIPFLILGLFELSKEKKWLYYAGVILFYLFYAWYLGQWDRGFRFYGDRIIL